MRDGLADLLKVARPAVFFANKIGDSMLTLPTVRALGELFDAPLTVISSKVAYDLCFHEVGGSFVDVSALVTSPAVTPLPMSAHDYDALAHTIGRIDVLLNAMPFVMPHNVLGLPLWDRLDTGATVGFSSDDFAHDVLIPRTVAHAADVSFEMARLFEPSLRLQDYASAVPISTTVRDRARALRAAVPAGTKVLVVHADTEWRGKQWPMTRFIDLLDRFLARHDDYVAWVVGMGYETLDVGLCRDRVVAQLGLPLDLTVGLVGVADLFVGIDSSMLHAADYARVPGVGIFGPTRPSQWGFRFGPHRHVAAPTTEQVAVTDVLAALEALA